MSEEREITVEIETRSTQMNNSIPIFLRYDAIWIGNAMCFLATSRRDIYYNVDEDPAFRFSTTLHTKPIDFVSLIENWPITNDDARKANWARLLSILETFKTNKTRVLSIGE